MIHRVIIRMEVSEDHVFDAATEAAAEAYVLHAFKLGIRRTLGDEVTLYTPARRITGATVVRIEEDPTILPFPGVLCSKES